MENNTARESSFLILEIGAFENSHFTDEIRDSWFNQLEELTDNKISVIGIVSSKEAFPVYRNNKKENNHNLLSTLEDLKNDINSFKDSFS